MDHHVNKVLHNPSRGDKTHRGSPIPFLLAVGPIVHRRQVHEDPVGEGGAEGHQPNGQDRNPTGGHPHPGPEGVEDHEEPVDGNRR